MCIQLHTCASSNAIQYYFALSNVLESLHGINHGNMIEWINITRSHKDNVNTRAEVPSTHGSIAQ